ncbi:hypothetical protein NKH77_46160 [Streptomyces sp. M19]
MPIRSSAHDAPARVLIVDDEPELTELLSLAVAEAGGETATPRPGGNPAATPLPDGVRSRARSSSPPVRPRWRRCIAIAIASATKSDESMKAGRSPTTRSRRTRASAAPRSPTSRSADSSASSKPSPPGPGGRRPGADGRGPRTPG